MQSKSVLILVVVTAVALAAAYLSGSGDSDASGAESIARGPVFADLGNRANDVAVVRTSDASGTVTIERSGDGWTLAERGGFPVDFEKVQEAVLSLVRLEIDEPKTKRPENHAQLGVADPTAPDSSSKLVELKDASGAVLAALVIGDTKQRERTTSVFVRRAGEDQVYLCNASLSFASDPKEWLDREIVRIDRERVQSVQVAHANGEEVVLERSAENETQFEVANLPAGRKPKFAGVATSAGTALSYLALDDVRPLADVDFEAEPIARTVYRCKDGLILTADTAAFDGKKWIHVVASYEAPVAVGPTPTPADDEADPGESSSEPEDDQPDPEVVQAEVTSLNGKLGRWAFAIPDHKIDTIARPMSELLAELAPDEQPEGDTNSLGVDPFGADDAAGDGSEPISLDALLNPSATSDEAETEDHSGHDHGTSDDG